MAKLKFGSLLGPALLKYVEANNGDLPTDVLQLKPFFGEPVDDALLQRYEIVATGNTTEPGFDPYKMVLREKREVVPHSLYDARLSVSLAGSGAGGGRNVILPESLHVTRSEGKTSETADEKGWPKP